ncbi:MAG: hypothetical protein QOH93_1228 [Chloroflexia bacterium]|jgi:hypothetical protein|nr:hypothetical protein [Chloroflexia bacterium]
MTGIAAPTNVETITLEGFMDLGGERYDDTLCMVCKPILMQIDDVSSGHVDRIVEDIAIDVAGGDELQSDQHLAHARKNILNAFYRIRKARRNDARFVYWKRVIEVYREPDPRHHELVYRVLETVGDVWDDTYR